MVDYEAWTWIRYDEDAANAKKVGHGGIGIR